MGLSLLCSKKFVKVNVREMCFYNTDKQASILRSVNQTDMDFVKLSNTNFLCQECSICVQHMSWHEHVNQIEVFVLPTEWDLDRPWGAR